MNPEIATLHHFRKCRDEWLIPRNILTKQADDVYNYIHPTECFDFKRYQSRDIQYISGAIEHQVRRVKQILGIGKVKS